MTAFFSANPTPRTCLSWPAAAKTCMYFDVNRILEEHSLKAVSANSVMH